MSVLNLLNSQSLKQTLLWTTLFAGLPLLAQSFVYETSYELSASGDFDGDGLEDLLVVDRETGYFRIGYGDASSDFMWSELRASGVEQVTALSVGKLISPSFDSIAITAPENNRVHVISANNRLVPSMPEPVYTSGIGTNMALAAHFTGSALDDLIIGTIWNDLPNTSQWHSFEQTGSSFASIGNFNEGPAARGNKILLQTSGSYDKAALMVRGTSSDTFYVFDLASGFNPATPLIAQGGLPTNSDYAMGFFDTSGYAHLLFFQPGTTQLRVRAINPSGPGYSLGPEVIYAVPNPIDTVFTLPNPGGPDRLIILFNMGSSASVFDFNGSTTPINVQTLTPPNPSDRLIGAPALSNGQFLLLSADGDGMRTSNAQVFEYDGSSYQALNSWDLQEANPGAAAANVLLFQGEPFVNENATLVRAMQAGQWSTDIDLSGSNVVTTSERFLSSVDGLGDPASLNLGAKMAGEDHSLPSQYRDNIAIHSFVRAEGVRVQDFTITPASGSFQTAVKIDFQPTPPPSTVYYRINGGAWTVFTGAFLIFENSAIDYYALVSGQQTVVRHANYTFTLPPDQQDSDGDGVPDYVELGFPPAGIDPNGGADTDGDGFSDLEELVLGSDPTDDGSTPNGWQPTDATPRPTINQNASFIAEITPRPYDGSVPAEAYAAANTPVTAYDLLGNVLGSERVGHDPNKINGLKVWFRADSLAYQDGQAVKTWEDSSNFNHHVSQNNLTQRPTYKANALNGQPAVRFDGNDVLISDLELEFEDFTIFAVFKDDANLRNSERLLDHNRTSGFWLGRAATGGSQWGGGVQQPAPPFGIYSNFTTGNVHTMTAMRNGTTFTLYRNGVQVGTQAVSSSITALAKLAVGGKADGTTLSEWLNGDLGEIMIYNRALSSDEQAKLNQHFRIKYGNDTPIATLNGLALSSDYQLMTVGTDTHYHIETSNPDTLLGRELYKALPLPDQTAASVGYTYSGGSLSSEALAWISNAQATYLGAGTTTVTEELRHFDSLASLLLERRLASILLARGDIDSKYITLFPSRPQDEGRIVLSKQQLLDLRTRRTGIDDGFSLVDMLATINNQLAVSTDPNILQLKTITTAIYDISSRLHNSPPQSFGLPIDILRDFLQEGSMDIAYRAEAGFSYTQLDQALQGAASIMSMLGDRPVETLRLRLTPTTLTGPCTTLETDDAIPVSKSLFDTQNQPYDLLQAGGFNLQPGVVFEVIAYTDSTAAACSGEDVLEVISIQIVELPPPSLSKHETLKPRPPVKPAGNNAFTRVSPRPSNNGHNSNTTPPSKPTRSLYRTHVERLGEEAVATIGDWWQEDTAIVANGGRGIARFELETTVADMFRLELEGNGDQDTNQVFHVRIRLNDEELGRFALHSANAKPGFLHLETPWLPADKHRLELFWDDTPKSDPFQIQAVRLQQKMGKDSNGDGVKDWVAAKLYQDNDIDLAPMRSQVSPATIEGRGQYLSMMFIDGNITPQPGPNHTWSAQIPLSPLEPTDANVYFQNGVLKETRTILWEPTNVLNNQDMVLRRGDALLLMAKTDQSSQGQMTLHVDGESFRSTLEKPVVYRFETPGTFKLEGLFIDRNGKVTKGQMVVTVLNDHFGQAPAVWVGNTRHWDVPAFGPNIQLETSKNLQLEEVAYLPKGGRRLNLSMEHAQTEYVVARIAQTGAILAVVPIQGFEVKTALDTYVRLVDTFEDGSQLVGIGIIASPIPKQVAVKLTIFVSGVTFEDGSIRKTLTAEDFDELGMVEVRFNRAANSKTAVCHVTEAYQGFVSIGTVEQLREKR